MNAMNPTRKIGKMVAELLESRGVSYQETLPELHAAAGAGGAFARCAEYVPHRAVGRHEAAHGDGASTLLNPSLLIADEITSALDVSSQKAVAEMLVEFRDQEL
jgi:peptide/nickel transport system ATP-binding protein